MTAGTPQRQGDTATRPGAVLVVTSSAAFLATLDLFIVNIAFPAISADFADADFGQMSWILNSYTVVFAAVLALAGRLADRYGHRRVFPRGAGGLHRRFCGVRTGPEPVGAGGRPDRARRRRRADYTDVPVVAPERLAG